MGSSLIHINRNTAAAITTSRGPLSVTSQPRADTGLIRAKRVSPWCYRRLPPKRSIIAFTARICGAERVW